MRQARRPGPGLFIRLPAPLPARRGDSFSGAGSPGWAAPLCTGASICIRPVGPRGRGWLPAARYGVSCASPRATAVQTSRSKPGWLWRGVRRSEQRCPCPGTLRVNLGRQLGALGRFSSPVPCGADSACSRGHNKAHCGDAGRWVGGRLPSRAPGIRWWHRSAEQVSFGEDERKRTFSGRAQGSESHPQKRLGGRCLTFESRFTTDNGCPSPREHATPFEAAMSSAHPFCSNTHVLVV